MTRSGVRHWGSLLREAVAVLAAILVAFALDAWWDARVERTEMLAALEAVSVEIGENIVLADSIIASNERALAASERMFALSPDEVPGLSEAELVDVRQFGNFNLMNPRGGAITAFIEGGFLAAVDDVGLRATVAGIPSILDELSEEAQQWNALGVLTFGPTLEAVGPENIPRFNPFAPPEDFRMVLAAIVGSERARVAHGGPSMVIRVYQAELAGVSLGLADVRARIDAALAASR